MLFTPFKSSMMPQGIVPQMDGMPNPLSSHDAIVGSLMKIGKGGDDEKKKGKQDTYKTQAEVNAANLFAQQFSERRRTPMDVLSPNQFWVAKKPGDPVVQFVDQSGNPYTQPKRNLSFKVPEGIKYSDLGMDNGDVWYNDPQTGDLVYVDPSVLNLPRFKNDADKLRADKVAMFKQKTR